MKGRGWLLDAYIKGSDVVLWLKTTDGCQVRLRDHYRPEFYAAPRRRVEAEAAAAKLEEQPAVYAVSSARRFTTLSRRRLLEVLKVTVDSSEELPAVVAHARRLGEFEGLCDLGLTPIQWYLFRRGIAPSEMTAWRATDGALEEIRVLDDGMAAEPPPFEALIFHTARGGSPDGIMVYNIEAEPPCTLEGGEGAALSRFQGLVEERDPDLLVAEGVNGAVRALLRRARVLGLEMRLGRDGGEAPQGRVLLELHTFREVGLAGLVERARFTMAPMGMCADWPAGKTIDSRQCHEVQRLGVLVPEGRGGYGYVSTAWDLIRWDRGGLVLSPRVGLHENVGCLDFDSMFPNIIVRRNVSYETVGPEGMDRTAPAFLGGITRRFLDRRLHFKHLRREFPRGSLERLWCEQRQLALKLILVCIYGYSGCFANRFGNVRVFQEINRIARCILVRALNIALSRGFEVVYGDSDSLFVKRGDAARGVYEGLAGEIEASTGLPISLDRHFKFLVLLPKASGPRVEAARRYYGKLTDGSLFYRGIELRRHDTLEYIKHLQEEVMEALFDAGSAREVLKTQLPKVRRLVDEACRKISRGEVQPEGLVLSKRLRRRPSDYVSRQPHVLAAKLGAVDDDSISYLFVNAAHKNPYLRVMLTSKLNSLHHGYDRRKYVALARRAAENLLRPLTETSNGMVEPRSSRLDTHL